MVDNANTKIGVIGGSFDPVHNAHISLAEHAYRELSLSKVIFMPAHIQPFKADKEVTDEGHRINMLNLAIKDYPYFEVSDLEMRLGGKSYTARTLTELKKEYDNIVFILGADSYMGLSKWYMPEVIFSMAEIACAVRNDVDMTDLMDKSEEYTRTYGATTHFLKMPRTDISSTCLRDMLSKEEFPKEQMNPEVWEYIRSHNLYRR